MLAEVSGVGAVVDIKAIPRPEGLELIRWLKMYQGMGFIVTAESGNTAEIIDIFSKGGLTASKIGQIVKKPSLVLHLEQSSVDIFDFTEDSITGIKPLQV